MRGLCRGMLTLAIVMSVLSAPVVESARILAVFPFPSRSHSIMQYTILVELASRGHEVVVYSPYPPPSSAANITYVELTTSLFNRQKTWKFDDFFKICSKESFYGFGVDALWEVGLTVCEDVLKDSKISALLNSTEKFDLVFIEPLFAQESFIVFGHKFQAPVVNFQGFGTWSILNYMSGNSLSIPYIPDSRSFPFSNKMSFMERLQNTISTVITLTSYHMTHLPKHQKLIQQYYNNSTSPPILDMLRNISLTLANAHHTLEYTRPYTPNIVPIGGAHMSSHQDDLPQNIKNFLDDAKEGFIYFSLGTIVPAHVLPDSYTQAFLNTFRKLPNKVLWKFGIDNLPGLPKNVKLIKWAPQQAVLEHPNCVLFITHGGVFSQYETLHAGVPVVGIPFFGDQRYNVKYYEDLGVGVKLDFLTITEETFHTAITTVLNDTRYKKNAESLSKIVRDKPMAPLDSAVFWIEYVLRHPGQHLRPASALLPWYQLWLLDVATTIIIFLILVYLILYKLSRYLLSCCNRKKTASISNHKKIK